MQEVRGTGTVTYRTLALCSTVALGWTVMHTNDFWTAGVGFCAGYVVMKIGDRLWPTD